MQKMFVNLKYQIQDLAQMVIVKKQIQSMNFMVHIDMVIQNYLIQMIIILIMEG